MSTDTPEKYLIKEIGEATEMLHWSHFILQKDVENFLISQEASTPSAPAEVEN